MLQGLEGADRSLEGLARLHVLERHLERAAHDAEEHRAGADRGELIDAHRAAPLAPTRAPAWSSVTAPKRCAEVEGRRAASPRTDLGTRTTPSAVVDQQRVGGGRERHEVLRPAHAAALRSASASRRSPAERRVVAGDGDELLAGRDVGEQRVLLCRPPRAATPRARRRGTGRDAHPAHLLEHHRELDRVRGPARRLAPARRGRGSPSRRGAAIRRGRSPRRSCSMAPRLFSSGNALARKSRVELRRSC